MKKLVVIVLIAFLAANVGVPIVIDACPMFRAPDLRCNLCATPIEKTSTQKLTGADPFPCCKKSLGNAPLKFESSELKPFSNTHLKFKFGLVLTPVFILEDFTPYQSLNTSANGSSIPVGVDRFLFTSSLRI